MSDFRTTQCGRCPHLAACVEHSACLAFPEPQHPHLLILMPSGLREYCGGLGACSLCDQGKTAGEWLVYPNYPNVITPLDQQIPRSKAEAEGAALQPIRYTPTMLPPGLAHQHAAGHASPVAEWAADDTATEKDHPQPPQAPTQPAHRTMLNLEAIRDACGVDQWTPTNQAPSTQAPKQQTQPSKEPEPRNHRTNQASTEPTGSTARETRNPQRSIKQAAANAGKQAAEYFHIELRNQGRNR